MSQLNFCKQTFQNFKKTQAPLKMFLKPVWVLKTSLSATAIIYNNLQETFLTKESWICIACPTSLNPFTFKCDISATQCGHVFIQIASENGAKRERKL